MPAAPGTIPALPYYQPDALPLSGSEVIEIASNYTNAATAVSGAMYITDAVGKAPSVMTTANPTASDMVAFYQTVTGLPRACTVGNLNVPAGNVPTGGSLHQVLAKNSATNYDASWYTVGNILAGGNATFGVLYVTNSSGIAATGFGTTGYVLTGNGSAAAPSFQQVNLTNNVTGVLTLPYGGLGTSTVATNGILYGNGTQVLGQTGFGTAFYALFGNGSTSAPTFRQVNLTQAVTGVLSQTFGGLGTASLASHALVLGSTGGAVAVVPATTPGLFLVSSGTTSDPIYTTGGFGPAATAPLGNIPGSISSSLATAGNIGEYTTANLGAASALSLSTASVATTIASITLSAGDWDVAGVVTFFATNTTTVGKILSVGISNASNSLPNFTSGAIHQIGLGSAGLTALQTTALPISGVQFISSAVQTAYLVAAVNFTNATVGGFGMISARRVR